MALCQTTSAPPWHCPAFLSFAIGFSDGNAMRRDGYCGSLKSDKTTAPLKMFGPASDGAEPVPDGPIALAINAQHDREAVSPGCPAQRSWGGPEDKTARRQDRRIGCPNSTPGRTLLSTRTWLRCRRERMETVSSTIASSGRRTASVARPWKARDPR